ncbi:MAG TPA: hypothetical protein VED87_12630, partial [Methylocystis sp.]|nr:hypothetical protein [Methylocystis sp.]
LAPEVLAQDFGMLAPATPSAAPALSPDAAAPLGAPLVLPQQSASAALIRGPLGSSAEIAPPLLRKDEAVAANEPLRVDTKSEEGPARDHDKAYVDGGPNSPGLKTEGLSRQQAAPPPAKAAAVTTGAAGAGLLTLIALRLFTAWKLLLVACAAIGAAVAWLRRKAKKPSVAGGVAKSEAPAQKSEPAATAQAKGAPSLLARVKAVAIGRLAGLRQAVASRLPFAKVAGKPEAGAAAPAPAAEGRATAAGKASVARAPRAASTSALAGLTAFVQSKLPGRAAAKSTVKAQEQALAQSETSAATLSRFADMMRKQEVKAAEDGAQQGAPQSSSSAAAAVAPVALVEPGDQAAASAALSAREALRRANA